MLLSVYQRLDDGKKLILADIFANPIFEELVNLAYVETQIAFLNMHQKEDEDDTKFVTRFKIEQQKLEDIDNLKTFLEKGRQEFEILVQAKGQELNNPEQG